MRADLVPDALWERVAPLLPPAPERRHRHPGRLRVPDRAALTGVMYVLRTGAAWRDVPSEAVGCSGVTAWRRLRDPGSILALRSSVFPLSSLLTALSSESRPRAESEAAACSASDTALRASDRTFSISARDCSSCAASFT
ncbi:transposase [[Kitasatospora] papulosa]|uniref:transposase n=1 Tax=[Kitasatospora] papulosa TaxID=1464011 RepID=UPI0036A99974